MISPNQPPLKQLLSHWVAPEWPAAPHVRAYVSTRAGDVNSPPFDGFNTADHVGDNIAQVEANREQLQTYFQWRAPVRWINQTHSVVVEDLSQPMLAESDAVTSDQVGAACLVHTADCLPVFFTDKDGVRVALAHAGWRGLLNGVLENTLACFLPDDEVYAWLGPAIGPHHFEVGEEVRELFVAHDARAALAFGPSNEGKYLCDLYFIARLRLSINPRCRVFGGELCSYGDDRFFSYRQQPQTGRMLSMIWLDNR